MAERQTGQLSFTDGLVNDAARANMPLQRLSEVVEWSTIEAPLSGLRSGSMGVPTVNAVLGSKFRASASVPV